MTTKLNIIPIPSKIQKRNGHFKLTPETKLVISHVDDELKEIAEYFSDWVKRNTSILLPVIPDRKIPKDTNIILFTTVNANPDLGEEGYMLSVTEKLIELRAVKARGLFYALQTLLQLFPTEIVKQTKSSNAFGLPIPCVAITDKPQFKWRGMMLDVSRHFFPKEFIFNYIDYVARYKFNTFHLHLSDDQGWRIEIKKYPKLTETGAWRVDRSGTAWWEREPQLDGEKATYGGYYTQTEIKEIIKYARKRHITILPEIDMPGHSRAALSSYPQYTCTGERFPVATGGIAKDNAFCPGKDETFEFLENILDEVIELFPGCYIHVGGDECNKEAWNKCQDCLERMRKEGLSNVEELQSYFIMKIENYLNSKHKKLIGWDEILEGGLTPRATVMSWRGMNGGIEAARAGHDVVMAPNTYTYFDLGGHGCLWTETVPDAKHAEYMTFPRLFALAEVLWSPPKNRNWDDFTRRMEQQFKRLEKLGINYAKSSYNVSFSTTLDTTEKKLNINLNTEVNDQKIYYTLDGTDPTRHSKVYEHPIKLHKTTVLKSATFKNDAIYSKISEATFHIHKALAVRARLMYPVSETYNDGGILGLTNGLRGSSDYADGRWHGFEKDDFVADFDLGEEVGINIITTGFLQNIAQWIFLPESVEYALSHDGEYYEIVAQIEHKIPQNRGAAFTFDFEQRLENQKARFIRIIAKNIAVCPEWHQGAGGKAWLFVDEVMIE
jgi:hexosaminidase